MNKEMEILKLSILNHIEGMLAKNDCIDMVIARRHLEMIEEFLPSNDEEGD